MIFIPSGKVKWQQPQPPGLHSTIPVLSVPDVDGDKVSDVALVTSDNIQVNISVISATFNYLLCMLESNRVIVILSVWT